RGTFKDNILRKMPSPQFTGAILIALTIIIQYFIAKENSVVNAVETWPGALLNNLFLPIGITIFFYALVNRESFIRKIFASNLLVALGNSTYSFYLLHTSFVMGWIMVYISSNLLIAFPMIIVVSYIFYKLVEQPLASVLRKKWSRV